MLIVRTIDGMIIRLGGIPTCFQQSSISGGSLMIPEQGLDVTSGIHLKKSRKECSTSNREAKHLMTTKQNTQKS